MAGTLLNGTGRVPSQYLDLLTGITAIRASDVQCEQISLIPGSLATSIPVVGAPLRCNLFYSGQAEVTPGSSQVTVPLTGASNSSVILATYLIDAGGSVDATATAVDHIELGTNNFIIVMNAVATASVKVAWHCAKL